MTEIDSLKIKLIKSECHRKWEQLENIKPNVKSLGGNVGQISEKQRIYEDILDLIK